MYGPCEPPTSGPSSHVSSSQLSVSRMAASLSGTYRPWSVSSMRSTKLPPVERAASQAKRAVRTLPRWRKPVGEGANRVRMGATGRPQRWAKKKTKSAVQIRSTATRMAASSPETEKPTGRGAPPPRGRPSTRTTLSSPIPHAGTLEALPVGVGGTSSWTGMSPLDVGITEMRSSIPAATGRAGCVRGLRSRRRGKRTPDRGGRPGSRPATGECDCGDQGGQGDGHESEEAIGRAEGEIAKEGHRELRGGGEAGAGPHPGRKSEGGSEEHEVGREDMRREHQGEADEEGDGEV